MIAENGRYYCYRGSLLDPREMVKPRPGSPA